MVKAYSSRVQFRMFWRLTRDDSSFQYLERPGKPRAPSMKNIEDFLLVDRFPATYRHNSNGYLHIFDHGLLDYGEVDVAQRC